VDPRQLRHGHAPGLLLLLQQLGGCMARRWGPGHARGRCGSSSSSGSSRRPTSSTACTRTTTLLLLLLLPV
jgi:hypothetical protein